MFNCDVLVAKVEVGAKAPTEEQETRRHKVPIKEATEIIIVVDGCFCFEVYNFCVKQSKV